MALLSLSSMNARAQDYDGYVSSMVLFMPRVDTAGGSETVAEWRSRLFAEGFLNPSDLVHMRVGVYVDALAGDRGALGATGVVIAAVVQPADIYAEYRGRAFDLRAGMARAVWGRLDEFQPTDVVNPIDLSKFLLEGRSEARLPVALVRGRLFLPAGSTLEGIVVPFFRSARFDQLDEGTSPFLLAPVGDRVPSRAARALRPRSGGSTSASRSGAALRHSQLTSCSRFQSIRSSSCSPPTTKCSHATRCSAPTSRRSEVRGACAASLRGSTIRRRDRSKAALAPTDAQATTVLR
jgi:hypothetical protein